MLSNLDDDAHALAMYMSELSDKAHSLGWMDGLEHELWDAVVRGPCAYGHLDITQDHLDQLRQLAEAAGGWVVFDAEHDETFVPMTEWIARFNAWKRP